MKIDNVYIKHILECIEAVLVDYYGGLKKPKELFLRDDKTRQATLHRLQTLGQAVKNIPPDIKSAISPEIDWREIAGFRDVLVHDYLGLDPEIVWNVVEKELPILEKAIKQFLEKNHGGI
jgi:uncharacterized protein with HEPN domain